MAMSRGKVETISTLARWRPGRVETTGPGSATETSSYCWSDTFKIGIFEWSLGIRRQKVNQLVTFAVMFKSSPFLKEELVNTYMYRVFDMESGGPPHHSSVHVSKMKPDFFLYDAKEYDLNSSFIVDIAFLDLKISPSPSSSDGEQSPFLWPIGGMVRYLATETTHPCLSRILKEEIHTDVVINTPDADKYGMTDLKNCCEEGLLQDVNSNNVLERLQDAWTYRLDKLKKLCFKFLFSFGMLCEVKKEMSNFNHHADKELTVEMFQELTTSQKPEYI